MKLISWWHPFYKGEVDLSSGLGLFSHSIGNKTNNIGEFLAIVEAVKYILRHPEAPRIIYSDSITAITWYRNKQTASSRRKPIYAILIQ